MLSISVAICGNCPTVRCFKVLRRRWTSQGFAAQHLTALLPHVRQRSGGKATRCYRAEVASRSLSVRQPGFWHSRSLLSGRSAGLGEASRVYSRGVGWFWTHLGHIGRVSRPFSSSVRSSLLISSKAAVLQELLRSHGFAQAVLGRSHACLRSSRENLHESHFEPANLVAVRQTRVTRCAS